MTFLNSQTTFFDLKGPKVKSALDDDVTVLSILSGLKTRSLGLNSTKDECGETF